MEGLYVKRIEVYATIMQNLLQLDPPLPVETPKGKALAHVMIDYGPEHHILWVCFQDETGEIWAWSNPEVRAQNNPSLMRTVSAKPKL